MPKKSAGTVQVDISAQIDKYETQRRAAKDKADEIVGRVTAEDRDFTKDEETALTAHQVEMVNLGKRIDALRRHVELRGEPSADDDEVERPRTRDPERRGGPENRGGADADGDLDDDLDEEETRERTKKAKKHNRAFRSWLRYGFNGLSEEQRSLMSESAVELNARETRDLSAITGASGGFTVPQGFIARVMEAMKSYDGVRGAPTTKMPTDSGNDLPWPTVNDTTQTGERIAENTAVANQDVAFGQVTLKAWIYSSKSVLVPITLIQDTGVDIEGLLARLLGIRIGRIQNTEFTTGTGTGQPQGIVTSSVLGATAAASGAITYDEVIDLQHSVDPAYRKDPSFGFMFNDTTLKILRKLKDLDGRPIWMPAMTSGMADGAPGTLAGSPYNINQAMSSPATTVKSMLCGVLGLFMIRDVRQMVLVRLAERYAEKLQVGFFAFLRSDSRLIDAGTNPIKHLVHP